MKFTDFLDENTKGAKMSAAQHYRAAQRATAKANDHLAKAETCDGNEKIHHMNKAAAHADEVKNHLEKAMA